MASIDEIRAVRLAKLKLLKDNGINPYPVSSSPTIDLAGAARDFSKLAELKQVTLVGRVMALRSQGGLIFADLFDGSGKFQALLKRGEMSEDLFSLWGETVDVGDFVEASGTFFLTKRKEKTLAVASWRMLSKALRPLPEKWHGLSDVEERFRKRYLDTLMNEEVRARFVLRSRIVSAFRKLLDDAGFLEVETSMLQSLAGGANAEPFKTRHNALDIDLFLRIAPELDLKRLLVGGYPRVYEIGRSFRNEGIDVTHNPEFTTVEWYEAYSDAIKQRFFVEKIVKEIIKKATGSSKMTFDENNIDFGKPFAVFTYFELLQRYALLSDPAKITDREIALKAAQLGVTVEGKGTAKIMDAIFKKAVKAKLVQPTFVVDYPKPLIPLAKEKEGEPELVDAFQLYAGGLELVKAFSELNDPIEQAARFKLEEGYRKEGDKEAQPSDEGFVEALEYGMPPAGGVGIGIERFVMLLSNVKNIREVIFFPTLRPKNSD